MIVFVNGEKQNIVNTEELSYEDIVWLAFGKELSHYNPTVTYYLRNGNTVTSGILYHHQTTNVVEGMSFSVAFTSNA